MPIMKSGAFVPYTEIKSRVQGMRWRGEYILEQSKHHSIAPHLINNAKAEVLEADRLEREYLNDRPS